LDYNHYDLVINTQYFLLDQASEIIVAAYNSRDWQDYSAKKVIK
jgi:cytidylate kinase